MSLETIPESLEELDERLRASVDPDTVPALAWGIRHGDKIHGNAAGLSDRERGRKAKTDTPFALASVTKPMTATAIAVLADRGQIDLDAPINDYLGDAKVQSRAGDASLVTVRSVANHSAGLPLHYQFYYEDEPFQRPPFDETIRRYAKTFWEPGTRYCYSNLGYGLLDYVIERISGMPYVDFMRTEVFMPLGMRTAGFGGEDVATSYGPDGIPYPRYDFDHPGGSAAYASIDDLLAFGSFHLRGGDLLSNEKTSQMHVATSPVTGTRGYGLGWGVNTDRFGYRIVEHTGFMGGVSTILRLIPEHDLVIAIMANGQTDKTWRGAEGAMAALFPDYRARLIEEQDNPPQPAQLAAAEPGFVGSWRGVIETHQGLRTLALDVLDSYEAWAAIDGKSGPVSDLQVKDGRLSGSFEGDVKTDDAGRRPYSVHLDIERNGDGLRGAATTVSKTVGGGGGAPGKRFGNALAYFVSLTATPP